MSIRKPDQTVRIQVDDLMVITAGWWVTVGLAFLLTHGSSTEIRLIKVTRAG